jgi:hypothetical protein
LAPAPFWHRGCLVPVPMSDLDLIESQMHPGPLYREETFTDRKTATIRVLTPVTEEGVFDGTRAVGVLPLVFDLEARSLPDALAKFASAARAAVERALKELEELRREAASSLIVADRMPGALPDLRGPRR